MTKPVLTIKGIRKREFPDRLRREGGLLPESHKK